MRQTSSKSTGVFVFILELHKVCQRQRTRFAEQSDVPVEELDSCLDYDGVFLSKRTTSVYVTTQLFHF